MNLSQIKQQFQVVEDNLGIALSNLNDYQRYINKQLADGLLKALALWYENNTPVENVVYRLDIAIEDIYTNSDVNRIHAAFLAGGKTFTLYCIGGSL